MYTDKFGNTLNIGDHVVIEDVIDKDDNDIVFEIKIINNTWTLVPMDKKLNHSPFNNLSIEAEFNKNTLTKI